MEDIKHNFVDNIDNSHNDIDNTPLEDQFLLNINGYEGAIDLLLDLAKKQKVDLVNISILDLANQYLEYVENAKKLNLELVSDYLVMAAWLAFLKSKILLPEEVIEEITGAELSDALKLQLNRLQSMRESAIKLFELNLLYKDRFPRGIISQEMPTFNTVDNTTLNDLLFSYSNIVRGNNLLDYVPPRKKLESIKSALKRLNKILGNNKEWEQLSLFLPESLSIEDKVFNSSVLASTFSAALELAKKGKLEIRQLNPFGDIFIRSKIRE
jgi:segregation and condensation protein A